MKTHILAFALLLTPAFVIVHATDTVFIDTVFIDLANPAPTSDAYTFSAGVITLTRSGPYVLTGTTSENRIVVAPNLSTTITFHNASITSATNSPFALDTTNCTVALRIEGENTLTSTVPDTDGEDRFCAGLQVEGSATLTISGSGSLTATGGPGGAGIGSGLIEHADGSLTILTTGNITIAGGNITANGGTLATGIGSGCYSYGGNITITGGNITATGGYQGAGIGNGGNITIAGGNIIATGGYQCAGIGNGTRGASDNITITGGSITASGGRHGAGIGGGWGGTGGNITITGGVILAINGGQDLAADIGPGGGADNGNITITGGSIYTCGDNGMGIGRSGGAQGTIHITGGSIITGHFGANNITTLSGDTTVIIANSINTDNYGGAKVQTGITLPMTLVQALANNAFASAIADTTVVVHEQHDTTLLVDTLHDTLYVGTDSLHDTIYTGTDSVHDTVHINPDSLHDTLHVDIEVHDTLTDTTLIYDTLYVADTIHAEAEVFDTTLIPVSVYDTTHVPINIVDTTFIPDTIIIRDTIIIWNDIPVPLYIVVDPILGTQTPVTDDASIIDAANGLLLTALTPSQPFAIYSIDGSLLLRATSSSTGTYRFATLPPATYLLYHAGYWSKFTHN